MNYYPIGMQWKLPADITPQCNQRFTGKELEKNIELFEQDNDARAYDPALEKWKVIDPLAFQTMSVSPFAYCGNNPVNFTDPSGMTRIPLEMQERLDFGDEMNHISAGGGGGGAPLSSGHYAATSQQWDVDHGFYHETVWNEDHGWQEVVWNNYHHSYGYWIDFNGKGTEKLGFIYNGAGENHVSISAPSFTSQWVTINGPSVQGGRPDADGYLTRDEANNWYLTGGGQPLNVDISKIDLSHVKPSDFHGVGTSSIIQTLWKSKDGKVYGNINLKYEGGNKVSATFDTYDFEMHPWSNPLNWARNVATMIGDPGQGQGFRINFYGVGTINTYMFQNTQYINHGPKW